jgi:hypothetical protein
MTRMREHRADDRKMKELILYLSARSEDDPRFSSTKLNKLLFYCDFTAYRQLGHSITGHPYQKLPFSPAPKAMIPVEHRDERPIETSVLSLEEVALADQILQELWEDGAADVSDLSYDFIGWKAAALDEVIPYETVFVGDPSTPASEDEVEFCVRLAAQG